MAKSKTNRKPTPKRETPKEYIREKARGLEKGPCRVLCCVGGSKSEVCLCLTRRRPRGNYVVGLFDIDMSSGEISRITLYHSLQSADLSEKLAAYSSGDWEDVAFDDAQDLTAGAALYGKAHGVNLPAAWSTASFLLDEERCDNPVKQYDFGPEHYAEPEPPELRPEEAYEHPAPEAARKLRHRTIESALTDEQYAARLPEKLIERIKKLKRQATLADIDAALRKALAESRRALDEERLDDVDSSVIFHSAVLLGEMASDMSVSLLLETLRQPEELLIHHFGEEASEVLAQSLYKAAGGKLTPAAEFLTERRLDGASRTIALDTVRLAVGLDPSRRDEAIEILDKLFTDKLRISGEGGELSVRLTSVAAVLAADLGASRLAGEEERLYEAGLIDTAITGPMDRLLARMESGVTDIEPARLLTSQEIYDKL